MRDSPGKASARKVVYEQCFGRWLSDDQLRAGHILTLLGEEPHELRYTDARGIPRSNIHSVERKERVYWGQDDERLGVNLYFGDLVDHLRHLLHANQNFLELNLDIEGSYRKQIEPAILSVLLFCWRKPETVVATWASVGRDDFTINEGIYSLVYLGWVVPDVVEPLVWTLCSEYANAGFVDPLHMTLRDLFWIRSICEHAMAAASIVGVLPLSYLESMNSAQRTMWDELQQRPATYGSVLETLRAAVRPGDRWEKLRNRPVPLGIQLEQAQHLTYKAVHPWIMAVQVAKFRQSDRQDPISAWLAEFCRAYVERPHIHFGGNGEQVRTGNTDVSRLATEKLWGRKGLRFTPRPAPLLEHDALNRYTRETVRHIRESVRRAKRS